MAKQNSAVFIPPLSFDREAVTPLHKQLYESYKQAILKRQLRAGVKLPSTRELAKQFARAQHSYDRLRATLSRRFS